jgi:beta-lactam-binding protein with PASTA domain
VPALVIEWPYNGATERYARRHLAQLGCRVGNVRYRHSRKRKKGIVIGQWPKPGVVRPNGTPVNLVISRGNRH